MFKIFYSIQIEKTKWFIEFSMTVLLWFNANTHNNGKNKIEIVFRIKFK
jgi:hypothetical protein